MKKETENVTSEEIIEAAEEVVETAEEAANKVEEESTEKAQNEGTEKAQNERDVMSERERVAKDLEIESLKMEVELLKNKALSVRDCIKLAALFMLITIAIVMCVLGFIKSREVKQVRKNIDNNPIYENLVAEDGDENLNKNKNTFYTYYETISSNSIYGEAQRMDGAYYMTSVCGNGEMIYTDNSSFVSFIDVNKEQYGLEADSEGNFVPSDVKVIDPIEFLKFMLDNEKGKAYHFTGEEENGTLYFSMSDKEFKNLVENFLNDIYGNTVLWEDFIKFIGMDNKSSESPHNIVVGAGFYEDGVIIDFIYVNEEEYIPMYEITYFDMIEGWSLGEEWYKQGSDKEKLASDKLVEVLGYMDILYQKYQAEYEASVSENSAE